MVLITLLTDSASSTANTGLDTLYYVFASLALLIGFLGGMWKFLSHQRGKWIQQGSEKAEAIRAQKENSEQLKANTEAVARLTAQMSEFITNVHNELNGLGKRISRLEVLQSRHDKPEKEIL